MQRTSLLGMITSFTIHNSALAGPKTMCALKAHIVDRIDGTMYALKVYAY
jgi:hypothetical protein